MADPEQISITICGDGGCGKSSITLRLVRSQWTHDYDPTIEDSYSVTRTIDGMPYFLSLTDTAGQEEYRGLFSTSSLHSDAFLLVYDITSPSSLQALEYFYGLISMEAEARMEASMNGGKDRKDRPVMIVAGNKCDLVAERRVPAREGLEWARRRGCGFMETSARNVVNIEETFALLVRRVVSQRRLDHPNPHSPQLANTHPSSFANSALHTTSPLPNVERDAEKGTRLGSVDMAERPGGKTKRGGRWAKLKCW